MLSGCRPRVHLISATIIRRHASQISRPAPASVRSSTPPNPTPSSSKPAIDLKSLNAFAVSQSSAGGRRHVPPKLPADRLSPEYRAKARKITLAIIAAPIAIVTSYMLAMRVWGGVERKTLPGRKES